MRHPNTVLPASPVHGLHVHRLNNCTYYFAHSRTDYVDNNLSHNIGPTTLPQRHLRPWRGLLQLSPGLHDADPGLLRRLLLRCLDRLWAVLRMRAG